jgi:hypothetical protein
MPPVQNCIRSIMWTSAVEERSLITGAMTSSCGTLFTWGGNFGGKGTSHCGALGTGDEAGRMLPTRQWLLVVCVVYTSVHVVVLQSTCASLWLRKQLTQDVQTLQGGGSAVSNARAAGGCRHNVHSGTHSIWARVSDG